MKANAKLLFIIKEILTKQTRRHSSNNYIFFIGSMYETFLNTFLEIYETSFPYKQVTVKSIDFEIPCMC